MHFVRYIMQILAQRYVLTFKEFSCMPRNKIYPEQQIRSYKLFAKGSSQTAIHSKLMLEFMSHSVSIRTVGNWISEFKNIPQQTTYLDKVFEWHKCEEYGIPWTASHKLLGICYTSYESPSESPSGREALWWWRISQAAPELKNGQIIQIGNDYADREIRSILLGKDEAEFDDLNTFMVYKPYNQHRVREYNRATTQDKIEIYHLKS